jgi:hypothetical protein
MNRKLSKSFYQQIRYLLQKDHLPRIQIRKSQVADDAGYGVFYYVSSSTVPSKTATTTSIQETTIDDIVSLTPLCLYPGIYTPGLPLTATGHGDIDDVQYLANQFPPPSGIPYETNAYILNITEVGGYIDGLALNITQQSTLLHNESIVDRHEQQDSILIRRLDENPSACGHKINHSSIDANTTIVPFLWKDVFLNGTSTTIDIDDDNNPHIIYDDSDKDDKYFSLPNTMRNDNSPWYYDGNEYKMYRFTTNDSDDTTTTRTSVKSVPLCGAAVVVRNGSILQNNQELLLDYSLKTPLPVWAKDWYQ